MEMCLPWARAHWTTSCHVQVLPVLVQGRDDSQTVYEGRLARRCIKALTEPLEVQLGLLAVAQAPEEAPKPWGNHAARNLLLEDDNGCELEEQPVRCEMLRQAFRSLSATVPGRRQEEAGLQDGVELEEVPEEQDHWDPAKRVITLSGANQKQEVYSGKKRGRDYTIRR
ncbi:predicted protein [Chaetomium globosum CBS 148.51]|uniref:Uncharacterized protein n=1 Tax=Chaetomium globosum (strain ATCC 6205 / CBS 148.51 / DSM 1962 / NBRC 6347 / NRRL 1970) TaxID=306901 RepID=Q2H1N6_CHAGB|nr:uncharacterized protein CHGG_04310 [Chaetomium globosum CBS 148.51]EAQ87691.1 predicted protein [Chaetomium globosum CBS 148.51]